MSQQAKSGQSRGALLRVAAGLALAALPVLASGTPLQAEGASFALSLAGLPAGELNYEGNETGGRYSASGAVRSGGIAGALVGGSVEAASSGMVEGNRYQPARYRETSERDGKTRSTAFDYRGGAPEITRDPPRKKRKSALDPATQTGTVDAMTAAFAILRDRPGDLACALDLALFDGAQRASIRMRGGEPTPDGGLACAGEYRRVGGFSKDDMAEPLWPFTVIYARAGEVLQVSEVQVPTSFGTMRLRRR